MEARIRAIENTNKVIVAVLRKMSEVQDTMASDISAIMQESSGTRLDVSVIRRDVESTKSVIRDIQKQITHLGVVD